MSIHRRVIDGKEEIVIHNEALLSEPVLKALLQLLKAIPDISDLQATLVQMETICVKHASEEFTLWEYEQKQLLFLHEFLRKIRYKQSGDTIE